MSREMKHSGIEWIGEIPKEWKVARFKFVSEMFTGNSLNEHQKEYYSQYHDNESSIPYVSTKDVERDIERINYDGEIRIPESEQGFSIAPKYSVLLCIEGGSAGKKVGYTNQEVCFVNKLCCINSNQNSRFIYFFILSNAFNEPFAQNIQGLIGGVSVNSLKYFYITTPPLSEQQKIANYLDKVCGEVDEMIALQEQMIEELKAYKQSVITEAVTKGLNPNVPMRNISIDWIGEIPEHWKVTVLRRFATIILGKMLQPNAKSDDDTLEQYICAKDVHFEGIDFSDLKKMYFDKNEKETYQVQKGDMLVVEGGAGAAGSCVLKTDLPDTYIQNSIMIVRPKQGIDIRYIQYFEFSLVKKGYVDFVCNKATIPHFTKDKLSSMPIPLPPLSEQQTIASYLDTKCAEIDALVAIKQAKIEELKEYKKSVIYEYVTGKKEVV